MPKIHLTIEKNYRPNWRFKEGCRELLQNAKDVEIEFGGKMTVDFYNGDTLRIESVGAIIDRDALLLGHTTKAQRGDLIGQWGDGMKVGILALVRSGYEVKIRTGSEVWIPTIELSDKFGAEVLTFDIAEGRKPENRVRVEVKGVTREQYDNLCLDFLWLADKRTQSESSVIKTPYGDLLLSKNYAGKLFVKGIFVQDKTEMNYGYNFIDAQTDIERRVVDSYDQSVSIRNIWNHAISKRPDLMKSFVSMLDNNSEDVDSIDSWNAQYISDEIANEVKKEFIARNGIDAIPVTSLAESREAVHYGKNGVIVSRAMASILGKTIGSFSSIKEKLKNETIKQYSWNELSVAEQEIFSACFDKIAVQRSELTLEIVDIVDFRDEGLHGLYKDGRIQIAKKNLASAKETARVLVHELAHFITSAPDGDKRHVSCIESIWADLFAS